MGAEPFLLWGVKRRALSPSVVAFAHFYPRVWFTRISGRKSSPSGDNSVDHARLEVEEHQARYVLPTWGLVVKHADAVELRVVVAAVLAVPADAVLVAQHLLKIGAHLVTALARLHVRILARRSYVVAGSTREKKGAEERKNVGNSV
jgi:hypothetical protein